MYWEEIIDILKKEMDPTDFKVPFTDWWMIFKNIEKKFIVNENSDYHFSNWADRIKNKKKIKQIESIDFDKELSILNTKENYWIILAGKKADSINVIYDAKPHAIFRLFQLGILDFYIVDKKYKWLIFFNTDNRTSYTIFKSGISLTPWDEGPHEGA